VLKEFKAFVLRGNVVDLAIEGVSDALAQIHFNVPLNALGLFEISIGQGSSLGDAKLDEIPFTSDPLVIEVVPEPASIVLQLLIVGVLSRRRRPHSGLGSRLKVHGF